MKIRPLQRKVRRRVGNLVVSLTEDGLRLRRYRSREGITIPWGELAQRFAQPARTRREAFARPLPRGWTPAAGSFVWVRGRRFAAARVLRVLPGFPDPLVRIAYRYAGRMLEATVELDQLRPKPGDQTGGDT